MNSIGHIIKAAQRTPWAILPEKLAAIRDFLIARSAGVEISAEARQEYIAAAEQRQQYKKAGAVAVIPVMGTISQRMNLMSAISGGTSTELLAKQINDAVADNEVGSIVLNVDSPGGTVSGLPEVHAAILEARAKKPIGAAVNALSASAAYWITSAASEISITPSGEAGSIGVFTMHMDESEYDAKIGVKVTLIHAAKYKVEGNPFEPLTDEARAAIQADVDAYYSMFVKDVAKGRGVSVGDVKEKYGQGRMFLAKEVVAAGMADRIETLDQMVTRMSRGVKPAGRKAEDIHRRLDWAVL